MPVNTDMVRYYADRAAEYEHIYEIPVRQPDQAWLRARLVELLAGRQILELACGTGYWTAALASVAGSIVATDINMSVLEIARRKPLPEGVVQFVRDDAFSLAHVRGTFDAGYAGFWVSHIPRSRVGAFLSLWHSRLQAGARVVIADNCYVEGESSRIVRADAEGNTYQVRGLENGARYEVLKNFYAEDDLCSFLGTWAGDFHYERRRYYWYAWYDLP